MPEDKQKPRCFGVACDMLNNCAFCPLDIKKDCYKKTQGIITSKGSSNGKQSK